MAAESKNVPADLYKGDNFLEDVFFPDVEANIARRAAEPKRRAQTPHATLKHKCRAALTAWRQRMNLQIVLLPSIVGRVRVNDGTVRGREIGVGKKGQADDTILVLGTAVACEYKAGADQQRPAQRDFQARWEAAGGVYVLCRKPSDLIDCLDQVAAQRGRLF